MTYARINDSVADSSVYQHVGWEASVENNPAYEQMWAPERLAQIQNKISQLLQGVRTDGRPIVVPIRTIASVLSQCQQENRPAVGDIFSRYHQPNAAGTRNDPRDIVDQTIEIIVSHIRTETGITQQNQTLTIWDSVRGDANRKGLRSHPPIKIRKRRPTPMVFNMRY